MLRLILPQLAKNTRPFLTSIVIDDGDADVDQTQWYDEWDQASFTLGYIVTKTEMDQYLLDGCEAWTPSFDFLIWKLNEANYSILARIARDLLVMFVSTIAFESAFSAEGFMLDPFRNSLALIIVEALIVLKIS